MDHLKQVVMAFVLNHVMAEPGVVGLIAAVLTNIDRLIVLALRFVPAQTLKDEVDRIDAAAKARIDKDATPPAP